jgi:hypothetical protein
MRHWWNLHLSNDDKRNAAVSAAAPSEAIDSVETSRSDEQHKVENLVPTEVGEHAGTSVPPVWDAGPHFLFMAGVAIRSTLALILVLCAVYVLNLLDTWGAIAWLVLGVTTAALAWVLLDDAFDLEGALAREVAVAGKFDPDPFGVRAAAVRAYSDEFVRMRGRAPHGPASLRQPGTDRSFRAHFPPPSECRRWYTKVLLISAQRALRVIAAGLVAVIASQLYVVLAG